MSSAPPRHPHAPLPIGPSIANSTAIGAPVNRDANVAVPRGPLQGLARPDRRRYLAAASGMGAGLVATLAGTWHEPAGAQGAADTASPPATPSSAERQPSDFPRDSRVPGGVALFNLGAARSAPQVTYNGRRVLVLPHAGGWTAVVGIALAGQPGPAQIEVKGDSGSRTLAFTIAGKRYAEQRLTVAPGKVDLSPEDLARHERERKHQAQVGATFSATPPQTLALATPVKGPRSSSFGLRRFFNNQPRNPHNGMDIAAPVGTPIVAPVASRVIDVGDYFFNGQTVWLDHGSGFMSMMCHLSRIDVAVGDRLSTGDRVGAVGATGRVTGPHLHWSLALNGAWVDPALFLATE